MTIDTESPVDLTVLLDEGAPDAGGKIARTIGAVVVAFLALGVLPNMPPTLLSPDYLSLGIIYAIVGLSVNVLIGYAGQVSLGHQAFVGVGAFTSAIAVSNYELPFTVAFFLAGAIGAFAAALLGVVALRLQGLYLALVTLAYGRIAESVIFGIPALTNAGAGLTAPRPAGFGEDKPFVYLCYAVLGLVLLLDWRLMKTKAGRAILATRDNEIAARSVGINTTQYKLLAFMLSGAIAGVAGSLYAHRATFVDRGPFEFTLALTFVLMTVVGGLQSRAGIVIGSMFFAMFPLVFSGLDLWTTVIGAVLLLVTLIQFPGGIGQQIRPITLWLNGHKFDIKAGHTKSGVASGGAGVRP